MSNPTMEDKNVKKTSSPWWKKLGPGLITGAADDDPSGIATYSQGGAQFGYDMGWTVLLTYPLMVGIQIASAHIGRVTGKGLVEAFSGFCPRWVNGILVLLLVVANVINMGADLNAMGASASAIIGNSPIIYAILMAAISLLLQVFLAYQSYVKVLKWLTLSLFAYVAVALAVNVNWPVALRATVLPTLHWNKDYITTVVAIFGTTISPYLFFWQASEEVEEIKKVPDDKALCDAPEQAKVQLHRIEVDTFIGMGYSNVIAFFIMVASAATLHMQGIVNIETTSQAAQALRPIAGEFAFVVFAAGVIGTGMLALPVLAGSATYAVASLFRLHIGLDQPLSKALPFYTVLAAAMAIGVGIGIAGINPIKALYWCAVINAVIAVPLMIAVMVAASSTRVMGPLLLPRKWKVLGWAATAVMAIASVLMFAVQLF